MTTLLRKFNVTNYEYVQFEKDQTKPYILYIVQYDSPSYIHKDEIGRFDFSINEGYLQLLNGQSKDFKRFSALLNNIFKYNERFMWNSSLVNDCKKEGEKIRKQLNKELKQEKMKYQLQRANDYLNLLNNKDENVINMIKDNLLDASDDTIIKLINNNFKNLLDQSSFNNVFNAIKSVINKLNKNRLTKNEIETITTRFSVTPRQLKRSIFSVIELKDEKIISLINQYTDIEVNKELKNINMDITNKSIFEWTNREREYFHFFYNNIVSNILDGTHMNIVNDIRNDYKEYKIKMDHHIKIERSFELNDYEVPLSIFIERSTHPTDLLKKEHEKIIKNAIEKGITIPTEVMIDYDYLLNKYNQTENIPNDTQKNAITDQPNQTEQKEVFYLYKNTFNSYSEAYNYAISHQIPTTMILSSNHPSITNTRLQKLEHEYIFDKTNMPIDHMHEYFAYISSLPITLDRDERYYKLRDWIKRHEYIDEQRKNKKEKEKQLFKDASIMLYFMKSKGLKVEHSKYTTKYIYNNEVILTQTNGSGQPIEEYYNQINSIFTTHFKAYINEYKSFRIYLYMIPKQSNIDRFKTLQGFLYTENTEYKTYDHNLVAYNRQLTKDEISKLDLQLYKVVS